jgi:hypothetical protein
MQQLIGCHWRYALNTTAIPSDASCDAGTVVNNRVDRITRSNVVPALGDRYYVKARQFQAASGLGTGGPYITAEVERQNKAKTKTLRIPPQNFIPQNPDTEQVQFTTVSAEPSAKASVVLTAWLTLPAGVTITAWRTRARRVNGNGSLSVELWKITGDETSSSLSGPLAHNTTGYQTLSASLSEVCDGSAYVVVCLIDTTLATLGIDNRLLYVEFDYSSPDLVTTL